jgi:hypothetical protein
MIVFCEECGERNVIDPDEVKASGKPVKCRSCRDVLRFSLPDADESSAVDPSSGPSQMELRFGDIVISISQTRPTVTLGRQEHNDLEVIDTRVSRSHARIEYRNGQFILIDHSTNGTYVLINGKQGMNLKRGELPLEGSGIITLGRKVSVSSPKAIHFALK